MTSRTKKEKERFEIGSFTRAGAARLAKTYRAMGYVPVSERYDEERDMHYVTYEEKD